VNRDADVSPLTVPALGFLDFWLLLFVGALSILRSASRNLLG